ncbi:hypothetical protein BH11BAC1_BH11BAC1_08140 [soil metagenome]
MRRFFPAVLLILLPLLSFSQMSSLRVKYISTKQDTIRMDSVSLVPNSFFGIGSQGVLDTLAYSLDPIKSILVWNKNADAFKNIASDSIEIHYRVFPFSFTESVRHKDASFFSKPSTSGFNQYVYNPSETQPSFFKYEGLQKTGSISRGVTFGNNQDVFVNSSLNLQLSGKLNDQVSILAAITDENIPVQPEGNTQQLQDFDKVFIQLYNDNNKLIAGDFELKRPDSYFMNFFKKGQGGVYSNISTLSKKPDETPKLVNRVTVSAAVSKGKFARNTVTAVEGNQGPYRLTGSNNESFIIVLAGTEKVYIDGQLMKRGLQYDYIIDYNIAELTFTARRMMTKESRISVEFEYSEKSYARSLLFLNEEIESEKVKIKFNAYSEQDSKNQPLLIDLDSAKKSVMANVGDSIQLAFYPTSDSVEFNADEVRYNKIDTLTSSGLQYQIFIYSTDSAHWRVTFSNVGPGNGDYIQDSSSVNGRVFKWLEPLNGIHFGSYAPVGLLITPKKQQLFTLGTDVKISKNNLVGFEAAMSNYNINLFSKRDLENDLGYAAKAYYKNVIRLGGDSIKGWKLATDLNYEFVNRDFKQIERFRNVEFERDWNLGTSTSYHDEQIVSGQVALTKQSLGTVSYQLKSLQKGNDFNGLLHAAGLVTTIAKFNLTSSGSLLNTKGSFAKTQYYKHSIDLNRGIWKLVLGVKENTEHNEFKNVAGDSLTISSFAFREYSGYINTKDSLKNHFGVNYKKRYDDGVAQNRFSPATEADEINASAEFTKKQNHQLRIYSTYRILKVIDSTLTQQAAAKTLLNRIDHSFSLWKGVISATTFYEIGTGQERKLEYYFLLVPAGQGTYVYRNDDNNNGVKDLNEFEIGPFPNEANYIKVFTPTNEYISTRSNQFNEVFNINPAAAYKSFQGKQAFISRFSNSLVVRLDKKTKEEDVFRALNPFDQKVGDSSLVSTNSSYRNTLYFNRSAVTFGCDATWMKNESKTLLINGFESRTINGFEGNARWNLSRLFLLTANYKHNDKTNSSEFFPSRNYRLISDEAGPKLNIQPGTSFRTSLSYQYSVKENVEGELGEKAESNNLGLEMKYNSTGAGTISARVSYIGIRFSADENTSLAYEMLEGLHIGKNFTWNASVQRSLGNSIQLSLNYDGRKSENNKAIHTGGVQVRAYF